MTESKIYARHWIAKKAEGWENICMAIISSPDSKELIREWIMLVEKTKVEGWDRDKFLDMVIKLKEMKDDRNN